MSRCKLSKLSS